MRNTTTTRPRPRLHLIVLLVALFSLLGTLGPAQAQENIEDARRQREEAREAELAARAARDVLAAEWEDIQAAYEAADALVQLAESRAASIQSQLDLARLRLRQTEIGLEWAEYDRDQIGDDLTDLAVREYLGLADEPGVLESESLNEAMIRTTVLNAVQGAGRDVIDTARFAADRQAELLVQVEQEIAEVQRLEAELLLERADLDAALDVRTRARDALDGRLADWGDIIADLEAEEEALTEFIRIEQAKLDRTSAADAARSARGFTWPTAGGIASYFGPRIHPILGYSRLHAGLDIGGRMGQPIWAAKEGTVIMARSNGGYGNTIIIDHGGGVATLYAHQSSFVVSQGAYVETGQHIGNVGSTGLSTGPHLHFEVRINGTANDPLGFLPPR